MKESDASFDVKQHINSKIQMNALCREPLRALISGESLTHLTGFREPRSADRSDRLTGMRSEMHRGQITPGSGTTKFNI